MIVTIRDHGTDARPAFELRAQTEEETDLCKKLLDEGCEFIAIARFSTDDLRTFMLIHRDRRVKVTP